LSPLAIAFLVLAAVLVGVIVPVLVQLRATLRSTQITIDELRPQLKATLTEVQEAAGRVNRISSELEEGTRQIKSVVTTIADLGDRVQQFGSSFRKGASIASVVAPVVSAAVKAFVNRRSDDDNDGEAVTNSSRDVGRPAERNEETRP